jgi:hypothetical protein
MGWLIKELMFDLWHGQEIFFFSKMYRPALWPTQPPIQKVPAHFLAVKWLGPTSIYFHGL